MLPTELRSRVIEDYLPRFGPDGMIVEYPFERLPNGAVADAITLPAVVLHDPVSRRMTLFDDGPISVERRDAFASAFANVNALAFVGVIESRASVGVSFDDAAPGTVVWPVDEPAHLIRFGPDEILAPVAASYE